ncbi:MAG: C69 family dipeptidase [Bacteroidales bacterium]|nr:C69 family dipeptidase [Bacteroidales bacterium]MDD2611447.1 C69 family dipeptidase [Bacteroidales bacterium]MDD3906872.1 C69 family dipeptidase [Bacteroidales bacterium]MDD4712051.1 C69 family dipeptidase [Bacteroidales bacterium]
MRKPIYLAFLLSLLSSANSWSCTNFIAGKKATIDGSVIVTYAADSHCLYGELYRIPAAKWPEGSWLDIKEWDTGKPLGRIPQVTETYSVIGNMNEYQVTIGETTYGGRQELVDTTGIMDYGSLIYIALQRSRSARQAIQVMTDLVEKYGYCSEGESFSIADANEAWIMEMIGKGPDYKGAIWVAIRIPDDCVSGHANQARIRQFPLDDPENCLYSSDVISFARLKGYYNGTNKDFSFAETYAPLDFSSLRGCEARVWCFFNHVKSGMSSYLSYIKGQTNDAMPLYIKPDRKLSAQDFKSFMRDHFEGTEFDMNNDIGAGPFHAPYRWRPMDFVVDSVKYVNERATATQQTGFSFVAQMRSWLPNPIGGVLWFGVDDANTNVYVPMYCGIRETPECFRVGNGDLLTFSWTSAFWIHNWVANMCYSKYDYMIKDIRPIQDSLETKFNKELPELDRRALALFATDTLGTLNLLTEFSCNNAQFSTQCWKKLGEHLMVKYIDGNVKKEKNGQFQRNTWGLPEYPDQPGYDERYYRSIAKETGDKFKVTKTIHDKN